MNDMNTCSTDWMPTPAATCSEQSSDEDTLPRITALIIERDSDEGESAGYDPYNRAPLPPSKGDAE